MSPKLKLPIIFFLILLATTALAIFTLNSLTLPWPAKYALILAECTLATLLILWTIRRTYTPDLTLIHSAMKRIQSGKLDVRVPYLDWPEYNQLADSFNLMSEALDQRLKALTDQVNEREAVFRCMSEGIIAITNSEQIITINSAALKFLDLDLTEVHGRNIQEVLRHTALEEFMRRALQSGELIEEQIRLNRPEERVIQLHGMRLTSREGTEMGAVIVLSDITNLHRLEVMRRDFVANVSHELRTPITSMKGFLETLLDSNAPSPEDRVRFLQIISRQVERLGAIVEDMLALSGIEHREGAREISLEHTALMPVMNWAIELTELRAKSKGVSIVLECPDKATGFINPALIEQAVSNLLSNAIEYSSAGGSVVLRVSESPIETTISVVDHGIGIEHSHLSRVFERFYRVEKGRSRKSGGTGLGLSIVKHIAQAHGGRVSVESHVGNGSVFKLHLPRAGSGQANDVLTRQLSETSS